MLLRPLLVAAAVGFAVSVAQYLPTLFVGGGRFATLTTEALGLRAGGDRRMVGVLALHARRCCRWRLRPGARRCRPGASGSAVRCAWAT